MCTLGKVSCLKQGNKKNGFCLYHSQGWKAVGVHPPPHFHSFKEYAKHQSLLETMSFLSLGNKNLQFMNLNSQNLSYIIVTICRRTLENALS